MRRRDLLHHTKVKEFIEFAENEGYISEPIKGKYEAFRLRFNNRLYVGHKRDKAYYITFHSDKMKNLFYAMKKQTI